MIRKVERQNSMYADVPTRFEAGTPGIAEAIGLGAAVDYLTQIGLDAVKSHEQEITQYAHQKLNQIEGMTIYGPAPHQKAGVIPLNLGDIHPHDLAGVLSVDGVAVRAGHHCAQPLMQNYNVIATARASFYLYNTFEEVDKLCDGLLKVQKLLTRRRR